MTDRRRLPLVEAPTALVSPRVARLLVATWDRAVTPALRASGEVLPDELADFIAAARIAAAYRPPAEGGTPGIPPEDDPASLRLMATGEVAALLACSPRNVRALAARGRLVIARRHPRRGLLFDRAAVEDYAAHRLSA